MTPSPPEAPHYDLWVSEDRTILVRVWDAATKATVVEVATRETTEHTWGPPVHLSKEEV